MKANKKTRFPARLGLLLCVGLLGGAVGFQGTDYCLSLARPEITVQAEVSRALPAPAAEETQKINVNTADVSDFLRANGIGPALAQAIADYRDAHGGFYYLEEIKDVPGIGEKRFSALAEWFYCPSD